MPTFLLRSLTDPKGYIAFDPPLGVLPRSPAESYVPWALTHDGRVVYAKTGEHTSWRGGGDGKGAALKPYDSLASQRRRQLAESELGLIALRDTALTRTAMRLVTQGIQHWHDRLYLTQRQALTDAFYKEIGHYFYTGGGLGFGRIGTAKKDSLTPEAVRRGIMHALANGSLDQVLAIHDAVGRKLLGPSDGGLWQTYQHWGPILRQGWFDDAAKRGRVAVRGAVASTVGGIVPTSLGGMVGSTTQARNRGVDGFKRDLGRTREPGADDYYDDLDARNLLFGAGISGTTGTLLQAAFAFAGVLRGEMLKQYVLAIIGYLVGGGMHSYHESMAVARKAGLAYRPGAYLDALPQSLLSSREGQAWRAKYHDIVELGATHWRNNSTHLPSHLNTALKQPA